MIATSMAVLHAAAAAHGMPLWRYLAQDGRVRLPLPEIQIFGGGAHAGRRVDIQDFMVMPLGAQQLRRGAGHDRRGLPRRRRADDRGRHAAGRRGRRRLLAGVRLQRGGADDAGARHRARRLPAPARTSASRSTSPPRSSAATDATGSAWTAASSTPTACASCCCRLDRALSDRLDRGPARRGRRRGHAALHRGGRQRGSRSSATTSW